MRGYFVLGSKGRPLPLPIFDGDTRSGNHTKSQNCGQWEIDKVYGETVNIPSRDKQVEIWSPQAPALVPFVSVLDSQPGFNYKEKLTDLLGRMSNLSFDDPLYAVLNNVSTSTHGSLALLGDFTYYGVYDPQSDTAYLFWTTEPNDLSMLLHRHPMRYQVYRFPSMGIVFLPSERICMKWWRWLKSGSMLQAFTALEWRLANGSPG